MVVVETCAIAVEALDIPVAAVAVLLPLGTRAWCLRGWYRVAMAMVLCAMPLTRVLSGAVCVRSWISFGSSPVGTQQWGLRVEDM